MASKAPHPKYSKFRFDAGSLALNFVTTVRHRGSEPRDLLATPDALTEWFRLAGFKNPPVSSSTQDHEEAVLIREAIYRSIRAIVLNETPIKEDIDRINITAAYSPAVPEISTTSYIIQWKSVHPVRACLGDIARDAAMLIGSDAERHRLKMCDNQGCQMLFLDNSPANRRRWCAMSICGNRDKIKMHRQRKRSLETV